VWAVVAALRALPTLDAASYRRLTRRGSVLDATGAEANARTIVRAGAVGDALIACARCHGLRGEGGGSGAFPRLAGQHAIYLSESLRDYALGARPSGVMHPIAAELSDDDMRDLARYFAGIEEPGERSVSGEPDTAKRRLGAAIAATGIPARAVPACEPCHGDGAHQSFPKLAGQLEPYLVRQLELWRSGLRDHTPAAQLMSTVARPLHDREVGALAHYYSTLDPRAARDPAPTPGDGARP
jgi:cytochrome c553